MVLGWLGGVPDGREVHTFVVRGRRPTQRVLEPVLLISRCLAWRVFRRSCRTQRDAAAAAVAEVVFVVVVV